MFHEPNVEFFYSSYKIKATHADNLGSQKSIIATAFVIEIKKNLGLSLTGMLLILIIGNPLQNIRISSLVVLLSPAESLTTHNIR